MKARTEQHEDHGSTSVEKRDSVIDPRVLAYLQVTPSRLFVTEVASMIGAFICRMRRWGSARNSSIHAP